MGIDQFRHITIQQLEALALLIEEGSFSRAASRMMLSQPSLSKHIKNLEIFVDAKVINRSAKGIVLTKEGQTIYEYARNILKLRDEARQKIELSKDAIAGHIFVGASTIPATYILPLAITRLVKKHPTIQVHITMSDSTDVIQLVLNDQVEIGFIGKRIHNRKLRCENLWKDSLVLIVPKDHPWEKRGPIDFATLSREPFVGRENGSATRSIMEDYFKSFTQKGFRGFNIVSEMGSSEAVKEAVISGLGISIISIHAVRRELQQGVLVQIPLEGPDILREFCLVYRKQFSPASHHKAFIEYVRSFSVDISF